MNIFDEIYQAILESHADDLPTIKKYIAWVSFRRRMHNGFYLRVHWIQKPACQLSAAHAHWIN